MSGHELQNTADIALALENAGVLPEVLMNLPEDKRAKALESMRVQQQIVSARDKGYLPRIGRNGLCPCGSGKKYKKCCLIRHFN